MKRALNAQEVTELLRLRPEDITLAKLKELFAFTKNRNPLFNTNDTFILPAKRLYNEAAVNTTVGRYIFNLFLLTPTLITFTGYINTVMDNSGIGKLEGQLSQLLINDKISVKEFIDYIDKAQWLGFSTNSFISPTLNYELLIPVKEVETKKKELAKKYKKEIAAGDPIIAGKIEKELLDIAKDKVKNNPAMDIYNSGGRGKFGNNYKNTSVMRGAIANNSEPGKYTVSLDNLIDGIPKEEYDAYADIAVSASFGRAIQTRDGGYISKQLAAAFQTIVLGDAGSDCGTKKTVTINLTARNKKQFMYRYVQKGSKFLIMDGDNIDSFTGRRVQLRSPMFCTSEKICSKCAGDLYFKMGIKNVGLLTNRIGTKIMNLALKAFHDTSLRHTRINIEDYIE